MMSCLPGKRASVKYFAYVFELTLKNLMKLKKIKMLIINLWKNRDSERLSNFSQVTQLLGNWASFQIWIYLIQEPLFHTA